MTPTPDAFWPGDDRSPAPNTLGPDVADLFAAAAPAIGAITDRFGLVSYGRAEEVVGLGHQEYLGGVGVGGETFLRACVPDEWRRLQEHRANAFAYHRRTAGSDRLVVLLDAAESEMALDHRRESEILAKLRLTPEEARRRCTQAESVSISGQISGERR